MSPEHHLQKEIINRLVHAEHLRFSELKPTSVDGNVFTYHLHQLLKGMLVVKRDDGSYELTGKGKALGITNTLSKDQLLSQAHSILLLAVKSGDEWLLRRRLVQPIYGKWGFIHGEPVAGELTAQTASAILERRTGLKTSFTPKGTGYIRLFNGSELESFTHFTLFETTVLKRSIIESDTSGENRWFKQADILDSSVMISSMADLMAAMSEDEFFFRDLSYSQ